MIYVMSDLHGCYEKYSKMLSIIDLKETDMLYILGDVVDRGPDGIRILFDLIRRKNVIALRGNHDHKALFILSQLRKEETTTANGQFAKQFEYWISDGGLPTYENFQKLDKEEKLIILDYLRAMPFFKKLEVNGQMYFFAHTVPEKESMPEEPELCSKRELILGEPDYDEIYFDNIILVTGHTPTELIDKKYEGRVWKGNNHIAVDCGASFGYPLGCICLDTMQEYYVD